jgi:hypothetical protein
MTTLKDAIKEGIEDGEIDDITADIMHTVGRVISFIPILNTLMSLTMLCIYAQHLYPLLESRVRIAIWRLKRRLKRRY